MVATIIEVICWAVVVVFFLVTWSFVVWVNGWTRGWDECLDTKCRLCETTTNIEKAYAKFGKAVWEKRQLDEKEGESCNNSFSNGSTES